MGRAFNSAAAARRREYPDRPDVERARVALRLDRSKPSDVAGSRFHSACRRLMPCCSRTIITTISTPPPCDASRHASPKPHGSVPWGSGRCCGHSASAVRLSATGGSRWTRPRSRRRARRRSTSARAGSAIVMPRCGAVGRSTQVTRACYFSGDTALHPEFEAIGRRLGPFDLIMLPIGAYEPRWFMRMVHCNPEDAIAAYKALTADGGTPPCVALHWGTFRLTDEPLEEPPVRFAARWREAGLADAANWTLAHGETRCLRPPFVTSPGRR